MLWRDVDLANGRFEVGRDKADAGMREVDILPLLREIPTEHKAASDRAGPDDPVFVTSTGKPRSRHNIRQDIVDAVVAHTNKLVEERGLQPLPLGITPHKLRHTFASILVAIGKDPTYAMQQLGHTDPAFTLRVYAHVMRRSEHERERLKALVEGHVWAVKMGSMRLMPPRRSSPAATKRPRVSGAFQKSGRPDLNRGPHRPERCALPGCATPRRWAIIPQAP